MSSRAHSNGELPVDVRGHFLYYVGPVDIIPVEADELRTLVQEHVAEFSVPIVAEVGLGPNWRDIKG